VAIEPGTRLGVLATAVIVEDDVESLPAWTSALGRVEEQHELLMPVPLHAAASDLAVEHVERGEQRSGAVALYIPVTIASNRARSALLAATVNISRILFPIAPSEPTLTGFFILGFYRLDVLMIARPNRLRGTFEFQRQVLPDPLTTLHLETTVNPYCNIPLEDA
jgi:hypothetical protein